MPLLEVENLTCNFHTRGGIVRAVDRVSFSLEPGQTLGIVGESGSGKSVTCYSMLGLIPMPPGKIEGGTAILDGKTDLLRASDAELREIRGGKISMIFQDPMTSLNPYMRVRDQIIEPLRIHKPEISKALAYQKAITALSEVGIPDPQKRINQYPHEFSGGMRQRVMIAMALITEPEILIADEPTTALDVTIQKQVLELIKQRQRDLGTAVIFITHDLAVVSEVCDTINVMYAGRFVESAPTDQIFENPIHPYTKALQASIPATQKKDAALYTIPGSPPDLTSLSPGCAFAPRCQESGKCDACEQTRPEFKEIAPGHWAQACVGCVKA